MHYKYDIFISYRRDEETRNWLNKHFIPLLKHRLRLEIGSIPNIYTDQGLEVGDIWPNELGEEISYSKILIALWSGDYLKSEWCTCEMSHMLERQSKFCSSTSNKGIIIPVIVHDGETIPPPLSIIQKLEIQDCFNTRMCADSPKAEKLADMISAAAVGIAAAIKNAPIWQEEWNINAKNEFYQLYFKRNLPGQDNTPKFA